MKLVRFGPPGEERPGIWLDNQGGPEILDVRAMAFDIADYDSHFFSHWGLERLRGLLAETPQRRISAHRVRLGPPVAQPANVICVGKNYADHAAEFDGVAPVEPILFAKASTSIIGPQDAIRLLSGWTEVDAEAELAVVIGSMTTRIEPGSALNHVAGYLVLNDVTERRAQRDAGQWYRGKSFDTFCPVGPYLVTADEVRDPQRLGIRSRLNGALLQQGSTSEMLFSVAEIISFISQTMTLHPGDIIATGTPAGVGSARKPPIFLAEGDLIEVEIDGLGATRNVVVRT